MGKKNIIYLTGILIICALIFLGIKLVRRLAEPEEVTLGIESQAITGVKFIRPAEGNLNFIKETGKWTLHISTGKIYPCDDNPMESLMDTFDNFKLTDVVSKNKSHWNKFQVDKSSGITVKLYYEDKDEPAHTFVVGKKLGYNPKYCYFRLIDKPEVWLSFGLKRYLFEKDIDYWRNKVLFSLDKKELEEIEIVHSTETIKIVRKDEEWWVGEKKMKIEEDRGFDLFLINVSDFRADGILPETEKFGKLNFSIKVKAEDSKGPKGGEVIFGFTRDENKCPLRRKDSNDDAILWIYEYKIERYKKYGSFFSEL